MTINFLLDAVSEATEGIKKIINPIYHFFMIEETKDIIKYTVILIIVIGFFILKNKLNRDQ